MAKLPLWTRITNVFRSTPTEAPEDSQLSAFAGAIVTSGGSDDSSLRGVSPLPPPVSTNRDTNPVRGLSGARVSQENPDQYFSGLESFAIFSNRSYWKQFFTADHIKLSDFAKIDPDKLVELLADLSPELSDAIWKYLLMTNPGHECVAKQSGTDEPDDAAQIVLDEMLGKLGRTNGTIDVFFNRMFMTVAIRGSTLGELIMDEAGREFVDIATPDTRTLRYRRVLDPNRGIVWTFGQIQQGKFVPLDIPTIRYAPLHPMPNSIEGRPLFSASFFITIFLMAVLRDFKRVIQQQGYPRLDVEIDFDKIRDAMPEDAQSDPEKFEKWVNKVVDDVKKVYSSLKPDDTYIHATVTKVNQPVGAINTNSLSAMDGLFKALERMCARAMHTMPLLMGITDGVSEANANRQWEIYSKGCEIIQHLVENVVGPLLQMGLEAQGVLADVELRFAQMRAAEKLRDAQVEFLETQTAVTQRNEGFITQDQAAVKCAGVKNAAFPGPQYSAVAPGAGGDAPGVAGQGPNGGELKSVNQEMMDIIWNRIRTPTGAEVSAVAEIWKENAPAPAVELIDATAAEN